MDSRTDEYKVHIHLIRHGESESNVHCDFICGQSNHSPLTTMGQQQAELLGKRFKHEKLKFDYIISSSAVRAKTTAHIALKQIDIDPSSIILTDALIEQSQGQWEGGVRRHIYNSDTLERLKNDPFDFLPDAGESMRMVQKRAVGFLEPFIDRAKQQSLEEKRPIHIIVFTHANTIRALVQHFWCIDPKIIWLSQLNNTSITQFTHIPLGVIVKKFNDDAHINFSIIDNEKHQS